MYIILLLVLYSLRHPPLAIGHPELASSIHLTSLRPNKSSSVFSRSLAFYTGRWSYSSVPIQIVLVLAPYLSRYSHKGTFNGVGQVTWPQTSIELPGKHRKVRKRWWWHYLGTSISSPGASAEKGPLIRTVSSYSVGIEDSYGDCRILKVSSDTKRKNSSIKMGNRQQ